MITTTHHLTDEFKHLVRNYTHSAITKFEVHGKKELLEWLKIISAKHRLHFILIKSDGDFVSSSEPIKPSHKKILNDFIQDTLPHGIIKQPKLVVSNEIMTQSNNQYRLIISSDKPMLYRSIHIPWKYILRQILIVIFLNGFLCYFLSKYLTRPLEKLGETAKKIAYGYLNIKVDKSLLDRPDEIGQLSNRVSRMTSRLKHLLHTKERLLEDISHELRSPLARLQLTVELARAKVPPDCNEDLDRMDLEITRLNDLIGELLSLAKLEDPSRKLTLEPTNLNTMIQSLLKDASYEYLNKQIETRFKHTEQVIAELDYKLIHRAIENILRNAFKYTPKHSLITVELHKKPTHVEISIADQGTGVPEEDLKAIFNPFYRVDPSRTISTGGYGIGLAITNQAVELHHGELFAENQTTTGLKVTMRLPLVQLSDTKAIIPEK